MDRKIEQIFVKNFIVKDKRERTLFELSSDKKRDSIIHRIFGLLDDKYKVFCEYKINYEEFLSIIKKYADVKKNCYVIADSADDGQILRLDKAYNNMMFESGDYFIFYQDNIVIAKEEVIFGSPYKKILVKNV